MTNREHFDAYDRASEITRAIPAGAFMTTKSGDKVNSMVIGWGTIGNIWGRQVFIAYVRKSRFTRELLDANPEFTVNIPVGDYNKEIFKIFGSKSGRDMDKIKAAGVTLVDGEFVSVPGIKELPLTLECKVLYRQPQEVGLIPEDITARFYPKNPEDSSVDYHIAYVGEIVDAYILS